MRRLAPFSHIKRQSVACVLIWEIGAWSCTKAERDPFPMRVCSPTLQPPLPNPPVLPAIRSNQAYFGYGAFTKSDDPVSFDIPWPAGWQPHLKDWQKKLCKQTALSIPQVTQPFRTAEVETQKGGWVEIPLPGWGRGVNSSFHSRWSSLQFQLRFFSLTLTLAREKEERGSLLSSWAEAAANPRRATVLDLWFIYFSWGLLAGGAACARAGLGLISFDLCLGVVPAQSRLRSSWIFWSGSKMFSKGYKLTYQEILPLTVTLPNPITVFKSSAFKHLPRIFCLLGPNCFTFLCKAAQVVH